MPDYSGSPGIYTLLIGKEGLLMLLNKAQIRPNIYKAFSTAKARDLIANVLSIKLKLSIL